MPLRDHFRLPVRDRLFETLRSAWVSCLAVNLNARWLDDDYVALEQSRPSDETRFDIATCEEPARRAARTTVESVLPDHHEVRIHCDRRGRHLVAVIEVISPGNEDRPLTREGFVAKCVTYLQAGVCVVIIDVVTECHFNLHNDLVTALHAADEGRLPPATHLYAAAYRPVRRAGRAEIDIWAAECEVGRELPTMPLRLTADLFVPVEFELTYTEVCRARKLI